MVDGKEKLKTYFEPKLENGEEVLWIISTKSALSDEEQMIVKFLIVSIVSSITAIVLISQLENVSPVFIVILCLIPLFLFLYSSRRFGDWRTKESEISETELEELDPDTIWAGKIAITNKRLLGRLPHQEYSLLLLAEISLSESINGVCTIYCYNNPDSRGYFSEPLFQIVGIPSYEAKNAYKILREAREKALDERAREMGIG